MTSYPTSNEVVAERVVSYWWTSANRPSTSLLNQICTLEIRNKLVIMQLIIKYVDPLVNTGSILKQWYMSYRLFLRSLLFYMLLTQYMYPAKACGVAYVADRTASSRLAVASSVTLAKAWRCARPGFGHHGPSTVSDRGPFHDPRFVTKCWWPG